MALKRLPTIDLPENIHPGGFDYAAAHSGRGRIFVAHTANHMIDVIDTLEDRFLHSIRGLTGVAGTLVSEEDDLLFTSNRGENTVGILSPGEEERVEKVTVGERPNGLAYDPGRKLLLVANVGSPDLPGSCTLSLVDVSSQEMIQSIPAPGRTRWAVFDAQQERFYVNIADPAQIVIVDPAHPQRIKESIPVPYAGPHGVDLDKERGVLYCACDAKHLVGIDLVSKKIITDLELSGVPDVIFFNPSNQSLYAAVGDPGLIEQFDTRSRHRAGLVFTEPGAHTLGFEPQRNKVYAFLPASHSAAVFEESG